MWAYFFQIMDVFACYATCCSFFGRMHRQIKVICLHQCLTHKIISKFKRTKRHPLTITSEAFGHRKRNEWATHRPTVRPSEQASKQWMCVPSKQALDANLSWKDVDLPLSTKLFNWIEESVSCCIWILNKFF